MAPVPVPVPLPVPEVDPLAVEPLPVPGVVPEPVLDPVLPPDADIDIRHPVAVTFPLALPLCPSLPAPPVPLCAPSAAVTQMLSTAAPLPMNFRFMLPPGF